MNIEERVIDKESGSGRLRLYGRWVLFFLPDQEGEIELRMKCEDADDAKKVLDRLTTWMASPMDGN